MKNRLQLLDHVPFNGMVRRRTLEVVKYGHEAFRETSNVGLDLAPNVFHLVGVDSNGQVVTRKRCSRLQVLAFTANVQVQVIGMEAQSFPVQPCTTRNESPSQKTRRLNTQPPSYETRVLFSASEPARLFHTDG